MDRRRARPGFSRPLSLGADARCCACRSAKRWLLTSAGRRRAPLSSARKSCAKAAEKRAIRRVGRVRSSRRGLSSDVSSMHFESDANGVRVVRTAQLRARRPRACPAPAPRRPRACRKQRKRAVSHVSRSDISKHDPRLVTFESTIQPSALAPGSHDHELHAGRTEAELLRGRGAESRAVLTCGPARHGRARARGRSSSRVTRTVLRSVSSAGVRCGDLMVQCTGALVLGAWCSVISHQSSVGVRGRWCVTRDA